MKKTLLYCAVFGLTACVTQTNDGNRLTRLETEPKNCEFLYTLDSSATTYKLTDAYDYLEKMILEQNTLGDSYYIVKENTVDNVNRPLFGPDHTYKFKVKVYNCDK